MKTKNLLLLQSVILVGGTVFAWSKLLPQFSNFQSIYGTIFRFRDCVIPNPLATACFYGSTAFIFVTVFSFFIWYKPDRLHERYLRNLLLFCVLFAGSVVSYEFADYYKLFGTNAIPITCTPGIFPLLTPCFTGLMFFLTSYIISIFATRRLT